MPNQLPMRIDRSRHKAATMGIEDHAILDSTLRTDPHGRHAISIYLDIVDSSRLSCEWRPMYIVPFDSFLRGTWPHCERRFPSVADWLGSACLPCSKSPLRISSMIRSR